MGEKQKYTNNVFLGNYTYSKKLGRKGLFSLFLGFGGLITLMCSLNTTSVFAYSITMSTSNVVELDAVPDNDGVTIKDESINVISDCRSGYNLSIATPQGSDLYKYTNNTPASDASLTAVDGTSALNSNNNTNKWGYTLTNNPTGSTVFSPLSATVSTLKTSTETASPSSDIDDTFYIHYGVKVDNTITPGSYQMAKGSNNSAGTIVYYLTMDTSCTQYTVAFNANGGTGTVPNQNMQIDEPSKLTSSDSLIAPTGGSYTDANNNTITGNPDKLWTFWGWNTAVDGTGDWYKDREEVEDLTNAGTSITLYAQWKQATLADLTTSTPVGSEKTIDHNEMQDMSPQTCWNSTAYSTDTGSSAHSPYDPSTNPGGYHTVTLLDYRGKVTTGDNPESAEQYTVSKLADGNCWMTTNLNLGRNDSLGPNNDGTITLTPDDTDLANNKTFVLPRSTNTSSATNVAPMIRTTNNSGNNNNGTYYSWVAAVADTASTSANPTTSICAKHWDLPSDIMYGKLFTRSNYTLTNPTTNAPSSFLINGGFTNGASFYQTSYSFFWTNRSYNDSSAYGVRLNGSTMVVNQTTGTSYGGNKYYRKNIRCVASNGTATINYEGNGTNEYPVTGATASQENVEINSTNVSSNGFTRAGWSFSGWNTAADGSGTSIAKNTSITNLDLKPDETITLYAQWIPQYTITYINNCKSWATADANCTDDASNTTSEQKINLVNNPSVGTETGTLGANVEFTLTGWKIKEWTTNADGSGTAYPVSSTYTVPAGASVGDSITLYAHWAPIYTVQYDGNGSDNDATGMGSTDASGIKSVRHTNVAEGDTFDLFASNFKKAGHGFVGWSTDANAWSKLTDNDATNDAKIWGPNEIITAPAYNGTPITTLYAVWAPVEEDANNDPVYLQNWTGCSSMTATTYDDNTGKLTVAKNSVTALTDERDGNVYAIAKLADDNCWMIENLRLADTHEENGNTVATTLTTSNTNIDPNNNTLPITNIYNADSSLATTSNSLSPSSSVAYNTSSAPYGWCNTASAACNDQSRLNNTNTVANITPSQTQSVTSAEPPTGFNDTIYSYGNYYNWYSATAGYGTYSRSTSEPTAGDLCPAGWKLPYGNKGTSGSNIGGTKGGFYYLANRMSATSSNQVNSNKFRMFPNNFIYSGKWNGGSARDMGMNGYYWSSAAFSNNYAYALDLFIISLQPGDGGYAKYSGYSVRCLIDDGTATAGDEFDEGD